MRKQQMSAYTLPFTAWELRLYLDTHPNDTKALEAYRQVCAMTGGCNYACATPQGMSRAQDDNSCGCSGESWEWIANPWPWEADANIVEGD
ncbi:MAG: spore coat protein CotJB [Clostridia bacterium]|nr:spore coat protein CotJB [Clostridia bacterium]